MSWSAIGNPGGSSSKIMDLSFPTWFLTALCSGLWYRRRPARRTCKGQDDNTNPWPVPLCVNKYLHICRRTRSIYGTVRGQFERTNDFVLWPMHIMYTDSFWSNSGRGGTRVCRCQPTGFVAVGWWIFWVDDSRFADSVCKIGPKVRECKLPRNICPSCIYSSYNRTVSGRSIRKTGSAVSCRFAYREKIVKPQVSVIHMRLVILSFSHLYVLLLFYYVINSK